MWLLPRMLSCVPKDEVLFMSLKEHSEPLAENCSWMSSLTKFGKRIGPRFPDGSINWQCPCMGGGSLVAHRCGHFFRQLYVCMSADDKEDATVKCPEEFLDWAACMQNLSEERRAQMRAHLHQKSEEKS